MKTKKLNITVLLVAVFLIYNNAIFAQSIREKLVEKGFSNSVNIRGFHGTDIFFISDNDDYELIYDRSKDLIEKDTILSFSFNGQTMIGENKHSWYLFNNSLVEKYGWKPVKLSKKNYDNIEVLCWTEFIGFKGERKWFLRFNDNLDGLNKHNEMHFDGSWYYIYEGGLIVKIKENNKLVYQYLRYENRSRYDMSTGKRIHNTDYRFLQPDGKFKADSIIILPEAFRHFSLIILDDKIQVYSFIEDKIIESNILRHYQIPFYGIPLVLTDTYIAFGGDIWHRFNMENPVSVKFSAVGEFVGGEVTLKSGAKVKVDFWKGEIVK
jgi:hypothetical protein